MPVLAPARTAPMMKGAAATGRRRGRADGCREARADTLKMLALVDFYLPFLPLERRHIEQCGCLPSAAAVIP